MSHYAKVVNGIVQQVIVAEADFFNTFVDTSAGEWIKTSYNTIGNQHIQGGIPLRGNFAGIGYIYDKINDVFYASQPYPSWILNQSTWMWDAPVPYPSDNNRYNWDETIKNWVAF
jgi:hypothetical protein